MQNQKHPHFSFILPTALLFFLVLTACSPISTLTFLESVENDPKAEIVFQVRPPSAVLENEKVILEILDDVTGSYFNPIQYEMAPQDAQNYFIRIPLVIGSEVKYRFLRKGTQTNYEFTTQNKQVRFRILKVSGPLLLQDSIAAWSDQPFSGAIGRIRGQLIDVENTAPIPNMIISAAGMQTISSADGTFILEGLPVSTLNVVITSPDGSYESFQQGAVIADEATTPIFISMKKRPVVEVTFVIKTPAGFTTDIPLRFASNLSSLGYPNADLASGSSTVSSNLPIIEKVSQDQYMIKLNLPVGSDLKYKFTFGDGFWNSELDNSGNFVTRELIVPEKNVAIKKQVAAFKSPSFGEIIFKLSTPATTPVNDLVSIQLNPFGWMEPLPMVKTGENEWTYTLYSPIHFLGSIEYRFCRNDQCDIALSQSNSVDLVTGSAEPQLVTLSIENWANLALSAGPTTVDTNGSSLSPRPNFLTGVELINDMPPSWQASIDQGLQSIAGTGSNWVILSPTWSETSVNPPMIEPVPGSDLMWPELQNSITRVSLANLHPVLFPRLNFLESEDQFWKNAKKDGGWWQSLFDRYQRFILSSADLAAMMKVDALIVGDPAMAPAMSSGKLSNGESSSSPANSDEQWSQLIQDIRARYTGPIIGVISLPSVNSSYPAWLKDVDAIYVLFSPSLIEAGDSSVENLKNLFGARLDELVLPLYDKFSKPILIGINYPSNNSSLNGCVAINDSCLDTNGSDTPDSQIDMDLQSRIYNAAVISGASRAWVSGFISRGFNPTVVTHDSGPSIYGKPASDVLWFWFHFILDKAP